MTDVDKDLVIRESKDLLHQLKKKLITYSENDVFSSSLIIQFQIAKGIFQNISTAHVVFRGFD